MKLIYCPLFRNQTYKYGMAVIKNVLGFLMSEAAAQDGVDSPLIQDVSNEGVAWSLLANAPLIILGQTIGQLWGVEVCEDVPVPWIILCDNE